MLDINGMEVRKKRPRGFKKEAQGVQVSPLNPLSVAPCLLLRKFRFHVRVEPRLLLREPRGKVRLQLLLHGPVHPSIRLCAAAQRQGPRCHGMRARRRARAEKCRRQKAAAQRVKLGHSWIWRFGRGSLGMGGEAGGVLAWWLWLVEGFVTGLCVVAVPFSESRASSREKASFACVA